MAGTPNREFAAVSTGTSARAEIRRPLQKNISRGLAASAALRLPPSAMNIAPVTVRVAIPFRFHLDKPIL